jgi:hypothetical protein
MLMALTQLDWLFMVRQKIFQYNDADDLSALTESYMPVIGIRRITIDWTGRG